MRAPLIRSTLAFILAISVKAAVAQPAPQPPVDPPPAPAPQDWLPKNEADLRVLNKVDAHVAQIVLKAGQVAQFGTMSITLRNCVTRPPDEIADAAAYLLVQDSRAGVPAFAGWMLAREPGLNMIEHPLYNVRLMGCR